MRTRLTALLFVGLLATATQVTAAYGSLWVFGDSLADSGNIFIATGFDTEPSPYTNLVPSRAYPSGTFSNGAVWVQLLAGSLGFNLEPSLAGGTNFAFGGAVTGALPAIGVTPGLFDPVPVLSQAQFAATGAVPANGLYVVGGGGNDVRAAGQYIAGGGDLPDAFGAMSNAVDNLALAIGELADAGATQFLVPNLPDVGRAPALQALDAVTPGAAELASLLADDFNAKLAVKLTELGGLYPAIAITQLDTFSLVNAVFDDPLAFGLTDTTSPCALGNAGAGCTNPQEYLFWDGLHPTTAAHQISADAAFATVVPLPGALWMFGAGLLALGSARCKRVLSPAPSA